jgi:enolase
MSKIKNILAWEILDSRARPTLAVKVILNNNISAIAMVPSGASTGTQEALELRDGDKKRYFSQGQLKAISNIEKKIKKALINKKINNQTEIDEIMIELDGSDNKRNLGANAILGVSMAVAKAAATNLNIPLYQYLAQFNPLIKDKFVMPIPMMNLLNGGRHANWSSDFQEYMLLPIKAKKFSQALRMIVEIYHELKEILIKNEKFTGLGDEGGFAPGFNSNSEPFELLSKAIKKAGYKLKEDIVFAIDAAASEFFSNNKYQLKKDNLKLSGAQLTKYYLQLIKKYPLVSIEDPFAEKDFKSFSLLTEKISKNYQIMGDDLYVTNIALIEKGLKLKASNSVLIKLNQIGTVSETIKAILLCQANNWQYIISHRSGETEDSFIADFAVAMGGGQIKTGAPARGERTAKYNRLLEIEKELGRQAVYPKFPYLGL